MKLIAPDYYSQFRCIAGDCKHSCCIGWEIDIDEASLARFDAVEGALSARLQQSIDRRGEVPHFILGKDDRCPFLNSANLCDLILGLGEDCLCQICADHPRFRSHFSDRTELGLGLCCEAAAELILSRLTPTQLTTLESEGENSPDEWEVEFFTLRDNALAIAQDREFTVAERMENLADYFTVPLPEPDPAHWMQVYLELERLDEGWTEILRRLTNKRDGESPSPTDEIQQVPTSHRGGNLTSAGPNLCETMREQLLVYFLYRHLPTAFDWGDTAAGVWFAILSTQMLLWLQDANPDLPLTDLSRRYSGEIEYSDENIEILMNLLYEAPHP